MTEFYDPTVDLDPNLQDKENKLVNKALTKFPIPYLSGLKLEADIKLGNLTLNTIDNDNVVWVCTDVEGWWNFPDPELPDLVRGWGDGSYDARGRWASRGITLRGVFLTQDPSQVPAARAKLIEAANLVYSGGWLLVNEVPWKGSFVRLSGRPEIATVSPRGRTEFSIGLKAADPIKYEYVDGVEDGYRSVTLTPSSPSTTINNTGNTSVPIQIELSKNFTVPTGPASGATLVPVSFYQRTEDVITLQFASAPPFSAGNLVYLANIHPTMDGYQVVNVVDGDIIQIISQGADIAITAAASNASVSLSPGPTTVANATNDQIMRIIGDTTANNRLEIDTYNREVLDVEYDGTDVVNVENGRAKLSVLSDWIYLEPGANVFTITNFPAGSSCTIYYRSGWIG